MLLLGVLIVAGGFVIFSSPSSPITAPMKAAQISDQLLVSSVNPVPFADDLTSEQKLAELEAPENITVLYSDNPELNCGLFGKFQPAPDYDDGLIAGCFSPQAPDHLVVYWGKQASYEYRLMALLHEYAHYTQYKESPSKYYQLNTGKVNLLEADADCRALHMGAVPLPELSCTIQNWHPGWYSEQ